MRSPTLARMVMASLLSACGGGSTGDGGGAAGGGGGGGGGAGGCTPSRTCVTQGFQCGTFTDSCGGTQQCGACAAGSSCTETDGTPGYCQFVGSLPAAGNPDATCSQALPAAARPVDTSRPTTVVGTGTAASCTFAKVKAAVEAGGIVTFDCGTSPVTIPVTETIRLNSRKDTVVDGASRITLDGGHAVRILYWNNDDSWQVNDHALTLQHLVIANGRASGTQRFTEHPGTKCPTGYKDGEGGALFMRDGILHAVDVTFVNNQAAQLGPDTGGGAVYLVGSKPATFSRCSFLQNSGSNGGGLGALFATYTVYDSLFDGNQATGFGANDVKEDECPFDEHQVGSGGNGAALYSDGNDADVTICGTQVRNNHAGAYGAGLFFTSNNGAGWLGITDSRFRANVQDLDWWQWRPGISTNANTRDPVNSTFE